MDLNIDLNLSPPHNNFEELFDLNLTPIEEEPQVLFNLNDEPTAVGLEDEDQIGDIGDDDDREDQTNKTGVLQKLITLPNETRREIYSALLSRSTGGRLKRNSGAVKIVASLFLVSERTVSRIWKQGMECQARGEYVDVSNKKVKNCGRKREEIDSSRIPDIPLAKRTTVLDLSIALNVGKTTLYRHFKSGEIRRHSNRLKPYLTEENRKCRLRWCISMMDARSIPNDPIFKKMYNIVHIDEKWFEMTKKTTNYYLHPLEDDPLRTCKSTNFIPKIMFLTALARPRIDDTGTCVFDGKIGIFPLVTYEMARRSSVNRVAGTIEMKPITSINKNVIRSLMIEKVLPAIRAKWPREDAGLPIFIQQDNASTHINPNDPLFCAAAEEANFDIRLICQPANSPDLNILDLGFFRAIQSIHYKKRPKNVNELVNFVGDAFEEFSPALSNRIFVTLQSCMIEIMKARGSNRYKVPHLRKGHLEREGRLPLQLKCESSLVQSAIDHVGGS